MVPRDDAASSPIDIGHLLDHGDWSMFQKLAVGLAALAIMGDGLATQVLNFALPELMKAWRLPREAFSNAIALGLFGVLVGSFLGGMAGDRFGRRLAMIGSMLLFGVTISLSAFVDSPLELGALRAVSGLGVGAAIPIAVAMISEFTPIRRRSIAMALAMALVAVGGLVCGVLADWLLPSVGWQGFFFWSGVIPMATAALFVFTLPESPRYLLSRPSRRAELITLLGRFGFVFNTADELVDGAPGPAKSSLTALFGPDSWADTLLLWASFFFCLVATYTLLAWGKSVLMDMGYDQHAATSTMAIFNGCCVVGVLGSGVLFERLGSRLTLILCLAGVPTALALAALHVDPAGSRWPLVSLMILESVFIGAISNGVFTLTAHAYPPFVRATGVGAAGAVGRIGGMTSAYTTVAVLQVGGPSGYFVSVAATFGLSVLAALLMRRQIPRPARVAA